MKIPFIHLVIMFIYLAVTSAIPVAPSDSHPPTSQEHHDLQILFVSDNTQPFTPGTPDDQFKLDIEEIETKYQGKVNLLVPSDATATNQMLHTLCDQLDDGGTELDGGWYKKSIHVIVSGLDLVSRLKKRPSYDLDTRTLIFNFLIYLESAIERVTREDRDDSGALQTFSLKKMLAYLTQKLQIFINFTKSEPNARLTFEEMFAKLKEVYKNRFDENRFETRDVLLERHIFLLRQVHFMVTNTKSMLWKFRTLEFAILVEQWLQRPVTLVEEKITTKFHVSNYILSINMFLEELDKRVEEKESSSSRVAAGLEDHDDNLKLKGYLEHLKKELELMQRRLPTAVSG